MRNVAGGHRAVLQSFILDGIPHKEGGWHIERPCQIQPPTVADGWFVSTQTILTRSNATLSQARSHWPWLKHVITHQNSGMNFLSIIGQIPYIHAIQQQIHSRLPQYISQHSRGIHSAFSYATCTSFHLPVPWDPRPIEGRNQAHDEEKVSLDRLKDLHGKPNEVVHDEQQTKHLANTWPSCFRPF